MVTRPSQRQMPPTRQLAAATIVGVAAHTDAAAARTRRQQRVAGRTIACAAADRATVAENRDWRRGDGRRRGNGRRGNGRRRDRCGNGGASSRGVVVSWRDWLVGGAAISCVGFAMQAPSRNSCHGRQRLSCAAVRLPACGERSDARLQIETAMTARRRVTRKSPSHETGACRCSAGRTFNIATTSIPRAAAIVDVTCKIP